MLKNIHKILKNLEASPGSITKENIMIWEKDNILFRKVLVYALSSNKTYHIKKLLPRVKMFTKRVSAETLF